MDGKNGQIRPFGDRDLESISLRVHPGQVFATGRAIHHDAIPKAHSVDNQIINDPAIRSQHGAVEGLPRLFQPGNVISEQMAQVPLRISPAHIDDSHMGYIKYAYRVTNLVVFLNLRAVIDRHVPAGEVDNFRAGVEVLLVKRSAFSHGRRPETV